MGGVLKPRAKRRNLLDRKTLARLISDGAWEANVGGEWRTVGLRGQGKSVSLDESDFDARGKYGFAQIHEDGSVTLSVSDTRSVLLRDMNRRRAFVFEVSTDNRWLDGNIDEFIATSLEEAEEMAAQHYERVFGGTGCQVTWRLVSESHKRVDGRAA